ncbi:hypothetical protein [Streptomyces sp. NPDC008137]|uniref:hypothetical protein n=1 Tax=Streptomyces sp. NPDC008137 TaxID=3364813 RepID=UPI0036E3750A
MTTAQSSSGVLLWGPQGTLTAGYLDLSAEQDSYGLSALDPVTMEVESSWAAPAGQELNIPYMSANDQGQILVSSKQGHIYVVRRTDGEGGPAFEVERDIDLVAQETMRPGESLLNSSWDAKGNIWFTTGGIAGAGGELGTGTTLGVLGQDDTAHVRHFEDQVVENGIAVSGTTAYVVTGPAGAADEPDATGYMYALGPGSGSEPEILWKEPYAAGDAVKPGGFARGSGATPALLGDRYVAVTDNANGRINLRVYHQREAGRGDSQLVCKVPLFTKGASANDIGTIGYEHDGRSGVVVLNGYNAPDLPSPSSDIDGPHNDMNEMAPGVQRIQVDAYGKCRTLWSTPERIKSVPVLSTATGLVYGYTQDAHLAAEGTYVWYAEALDFRTGEVKWKKRTGAGGTFNDIFAPASLGPDGTLYQRVAGGLVAVKDAG